jgi:hypothetical protein
MGVSSRRGVDPLVRMLPAPCRSVIGSAPGEYCGKAAVVLRVAPDGEPAARSSLARWSAFPRSLHASACGCSTTTTCSSWRRTASTTCSGHLPPQPNSRLRALLRGAPSGEKMACALAARPLPQPSVSLPARGHRQFWPRRHGASGPAIRPARACQLTCARHTGITRIAGGVRSALVAAAEGRGAIPSALPRVARRAAAARPLTVTSCSAPVRLCFEHQPQPGPDYRVVVCDHDLDRHGRPTVSAYTGAH